VTFKGIMGNPVDGIAIEDAANEARQCAINILAQVNAACDGDLSRVKRVVKLNGYVACTPTFTDHPKIINGASDLMVQVFGEAGKHARAAIGVASLPMNACVEVEAVVEIT
jgi:enamine deaminase RidA (YjgF/YER057c/UK114 family)